MKLGCHVSISGGFASAAKRALGLGCEAFQVFSKNPRSFKGKAADPADGAAGVAFCQEHGLICIAHAPYILNLSTPEAELHSITVSSLVLDLQNAEVFGCKGLVVHCGRHVEQGTVEGLRRMVATLDEILTEYRGPVPILLENTAGQGTELGTTLEELLATRAATVNAGRIGFCFDTCHAFAAGLFDRDNWEACAETMRSTGFLEHLVAVHLNDSKFPYAARRDRHEKIGRGEIGEAAMTTILRSGALADLPVVLETPVSDEAEYAQEIVYCRQLAGL